MKVFIDLGAFNGDTIKKAIVVYPDFDKYIGFEPVPSLYKKAAKRLNKYSKVKLYKKAASTSTKSVNLFLNYVRGKKGIMGSGSTLCKTKTSGNINIKRFIKVKSIDFSEYLENNFAKDDFIVLKVDIEGEEYPLFEYLIKTGTISYINKIYCEWHYKKIGFDKDKHKKIVKSLRELGYKLTGNSIKDEFKK